MNKENQGAAAPHSLTPVQKRRLAKEARKLAMECLTNGPQMLNWWCGCAIGICMKRAGVWSSNAGFHRMAEIAAGVDALVTGTPPNRHAGGIVSEATRRRSGEPTAVVFPLLALADALDASASEPPEALP